jgi:hypothetical protein
MTKRKHYDIKRGRHKKHASRETREWEQAHLPPVPPSWMDAQTGAKLIALRRQLDQLA